MDLGQQVEEIAEALLANARGLAPSELPSGLAEAYGIPVLARQLGPGLKLVANVFVREIHWDPLKVGGKELEHGIGHELIELELELSGVRMPQDHEALCDRGGRALMLDRTTFREVVLEMPAGPDLFELSRIYPEVPLAQLGLRLADLLPGYAVSVWDGCKRKERLCSADVDLQKMINIIEWAELQALGKVYSSGRRRRAANHPFALGTAWRTKALPNQAVVVCKVAQRSAWGQRDQLVLEYDPGVRRRPQI